MQSTPTSRMTPHLCKAPILQEWPLICVKHHQVSWRGILAGITPHNYVCSHTHTHTHTHTNTVAVILSRATSTRWSFSPHWVGSRWAGGPGVKKHSSYSSLPLSSKWAWHVYESGALSWTTWWHKIMWPSETSSQEYTPLIRPEWLISSSLWSRCMSWQLQLCLYSFITLLVGLYS